MAGSFIPDGMNRSWGMASYVNAGVFLNHGFHGNEGLYVKKRKASTASNHDFGKRDVCMMTYLGTIPDNSL